MLQAIQKLVESGIIDNSTRDAINEAWEDKLTEAREQVRQELREEFARKYEHDKANMVEAIDKMVTESLTNELEEFAEDKKALAVDRVAFKRKMKEAAQKFEQFMLTQLAEEMQEFRKDRQMQLEAIKKLEKFNMEQLAEEISEFAADKQAVVEERVKVVAESKKRLKALEEAYIKRAAQVVKETVSTQLQTEITQLKEDIEVARENMTGRRIFEAFMSEIMVSHLNENKEIAKLQRALKEREKMIAEAKREAKRNKALVEAKEQTVQQLTESVNRAKKIDTLVGSLNKDKASVMRDLLESVETARLDAAFKKYLPAVLNGGTPSKASGKQALNESSSRREVTGNKNTAKQTIEQQDATVVDIQRLAGLK